MAGSKSPMVIELSSDSEHGVNEDNLNANAHLAEDEVFTLDWADNDFPTSANDILELYNKVDNDSQDNASISSAETEIYTPDPNYEIICDDSPVRPSQKSVETGKLSQKYNDKLLKEQNKLEKKRQREEKKEEELKQKRIRAAFAQKYKNLKPEESIKLLKIKIDTNVVNSEFGGVLITSLQQSGLQYDVGNQIKPHTISWVKKLKDIIVSDEGVTQEDIGEKEEKEIIYLMDAIKAVELINKNEFLTHVQTIKSSYFEKSFTIIITGMQNYYQLIKKKLSQDVSDLSGKKRVRRTTDTADIVHVSKEDIQSALIELQIIGKCNHCLIETGEELASFVICTTKSLSQLDYKQEKHKREEGELEWFAKADSKQCVKVDKNGNGLSKLWQQQICQFNAVGVEISSAIVSNFNSPQMLIESYEKCSNVSEAELLLQNIQIRRNAGILSSTRRIGPDVSKKMYHFYTSDDPDLEL